MLARLKKARWLTDDELREEWKRIDALLAELLTNGGDERYALDRLGSIEAEMKRRGLQ